MAKKQFLIDQAQAGYMLGVDSRSIQTWSKRDSDPLPVVKQGKRGQSNNYDPAELVQWYVRNELSKLDIADGEILDLNTERAKLARLQAQKVQLDISEREGQLVDVEQAGVALDKVLMAVRSRLLAMPTRIAPLVCGTRTVSATSSAIQEGVYEALNELADMDIQKVVN